jgi:hypothetical protein
MSLDFFYEVPVSNSASLRKIDRFSRLENGWRFGEGVAATPKVVGSARRLVTLAESMGWETDVFPGVSGELLVEAENGDQHYEFIFEINGALTLIRTEDGEDVERLTGRSDDEAFDRIRSQSFRCVTSDYFTQTTGHPKMGDDLAAWHFVQVLQHPTEFLSYFQTAQRNEAEHYATILQRIIGSGTPQQSSGFLSQTRSVPRAALRRPLLQDETSGAITTSTILEAMTPICFSNRIEEITDGGITEFAVSEDIAS